MSITSSFLLLLLGHVTSSQAWTCSPGGSSLKFAQIDAGLGQVVATDVNQKAFFKSGEAWYPLTAANIKHVTVGPAGTWGVDSEDYIFKLVAGDWVKIDGSLKQIDAGGNQFAAGVNSKDEFYCLRRNVTVGYSDVGLPAPWVRVSGDLVYSSCGPFGCWGVGNDNSTVYVTRTVNAVTCEHSDWESVPGQSLTVVEVSTDGRVFGVTPTGLVYRRTGVSARNAMGTSWVKVPLCMSMKHVTYDLGRLWAVTTGGFAMVCTP